MCDRYAETIGYCSSCFRTLRNSCGRVYFCSRKWYTIDGGFGFLQYPKRKFDAVAMFYIEYSSRFSSIPCEFLTGATIESSICTIDDDSILFGRDDIEWSNSTEIFREMCLVPCVSLYIAFSDSCEVYGRKYIFFPKVFSRNLILWFRDFPEISKLHISDTEEMSF